MSYASKQVQSLPPYLFSVFHEKKKRLQAKGVDVIDLGIGAPDLPTPEFIVERLKSEAIKPENHKYAPYAGTQAFREAVAAFYQKQYNVKLDPNKEVLTLIGSKEGIAHMMYAVIDPGDGVLIPDPGYPVYDSAVHLANGKGIPLPLDPDRGYVPMFDLMDKRELKKAKLMLLNYPSNPTGATVEMDTFLEAVLFAKKHNLCIAQDAAYGLVTFDDYQAPSILQVPGAKEVAVEFGSLSKSFNMTGWRIGYVVGNEEIIRALSIVKSNMDTGQFLPIQKAGVTALQSDFSAVRNNNDIYQKRMETMLEALWDMGIQAEKPRGTFFIWAKVPGQESSKAFAEKMLEEAGVIITPGTAFGEQGEGFFRISLSVPTKRLSEAVQRMKTFQAGGRLDDSKKT
ncbi:LL-diaminopimelate aminotransferase [Pontibacillus sp. HMF3514]|uniref:LL-diaminopimelate aminotransferase n=1 Tax=Pontibacillus sp. HMF3514 TaxID=2692425 RepID=UPI00131FFD20|nr:LL-diaminopimelate aminotransferase [Pontibacillus sp. HMF3514]QHE51785.1 aminotransferase class I/II-fold pyridoxal phosphate-dependent enzyme [Pontibacillus sp. HMF3514]